MNKDSTISIKRVCGGATSPQGFMAGGVVCGVRNSGRRDLGLLYSEVPCVAAGVYTRNVFKGAPLSVTREAVGRAGACIRAVVVNSGNANAATGPRGVDDAYRMQALAADTLGIAARETAVASTGVIGVHLPMEKIEKGILTAASELSSDDDRFPEAILTTDTRIKQCAVQIEIGDDTVTVGGTAKGSGMIEPDMGTMLAFLTTDAAVKERCLQETLKNTTDRSFNRITVDGDTSPSDMALLLANGVAGNEPLTLDSPDYPAFAAAVDAVAQELAKEIARDGEGATKLVEVAVEGAKEEVAAARLAKAVVGSNLVKAAVFGRDANWGRVLVAMGYSGVDFDPSNVELYFGPVKVFAGEPIPHDESEANGALEGDEVRITTRLNEGNASATVWGCDLTYEYVKINGSYRT